MGFGNYGKKAAKEEAPRYEVLKDFGALGEEVEGKHVKRLRLVAWNGNEPKFDIRPWKQTEEGEQCSKGITLTSSEVEGLYELLKGIAEAEDEAN